MANVTITKYQRVGQRGANGSKQGDELSVTPVDFAITLPLIYLQMRRKDASIAVNEKRVCWFTPLNQPSISVNPMHFVGKIKLYTDR